jgi:transcriptional regulator with XRE-family HTH domain
MPDKEAAMRQRLAIAGRLRMAREMAGLTQGQVAKMLGLHRPSISEAEAGRRRVSADELARLAEIYAVNISWLACADSGESDAEDDRLALAARELAKLKQDDLNRLMELLKAIRSHKDRSK